MRTSKDFWSKGPAPLFTKLLFTPAAVGVGNKAKTLPTFWPIIPIGIMLLAVVLLTAYRKIGAAYRNNLLLSNLALAYFLVGLTYNFTEAAFFRMLAPTWIFFLFAVVSTPKILGEELRPAVLSKIDRGGEHRKQISVRPTLPVRELR